MNDEAIVYYVVAGCEDDSPIVFVHDDWHHALLTAVAIVLDRSDEDDEMPAWFEEERQPTTDECEALIEAYNDNCTGGLEVVVEGTTLQRTCVAAYLEERPWLSDKEA